MRRTHGRNFRGTFWIAPTTTTKETMTQKMTKTNTVNQVTFLLCNWLAQERHCAVVHVFHFSWLFQRNGSGVKGKVCRRKDGERSWGRKLGTFFFSFQIFSFKYDFLFPALNSIMQNGDLGKYVLFSGIQNRCIEKTVIVAFPLKQYNGVTVVLAAVVTAAASCGVVVMT